MRAFKFARSVVVDRADELCRLAAGRRVLHVGCADAPYQIEQHEQGRLLHGRLARVAATVTGVDLDQAGVDFLTRLGFGDLYCASAEDLSVLKHVEKFDVVIAGEIVEHLPNPGRSLTEMRCMLRPGGRLVVTVPNALSFKVALRALAGREWVHPDHLYYFSPSTLTRLMERSGLRPVALKYYGARPDDGLMRVVHDILYAFIGPLAPWLADGLIVEAESHDS